MFGILKSSKTGLMLAMSFVMTWASLAYAQAPVASTPQAQVQGNNSGDGIQERMNRWTIGLAAGKQEGAPLRYASELAVALNDGDEMRIIPMVTRGVAGNLNDLLYLRGVDAAIVYADSLGALREKPEVRRKVNYIASLFPAELHILARPEIKTLEDLNGKNVNFNTMGTPAAYTGPIIFDKLGVKARNTFISNPVALQKMRKSDEFAAVVFISSKPLNAFTNKKWPKGFHFLPVSYSFKFGVYYMPSSLRHTDYPDLIAQGESVPTISVPAVLAAFDWNKTSDRYRRMERFVQYLFKRLIVLRTQPGYHPKWKDVNLAGKVPGWDRFPPAEEELKKLSSVGKLSLLREEVAKMIPDDPIAQERLLEDFLKWRNENANHQKARR
jgi:TRAP-type uncharacterized transport system substrate-binding protein